MKLNLKWHQPVALGAFPYAGNSATFLPVIPNSAGIYIFLRKHGKKCEALYVGKAKNLKSRITQQLNNLNLVIGIQAAAVGSRHLVYAEFVPKSGQQQKKALMICEKTLIRYYLALGDGLLNVQGAKLNFHELHSVRPSLKKFLPAKTKMLK